MVKLPYSHIANATLPSARLRFTSVFEMDTGGDQSVMVTEQSRLKIYQALLS